MLGVGSTIIYRVELMNPQQIATCNTAFVGGWSDDVSHVEAGLEESCNKGMVGCRWGAVVALRTVGGSASGLAGLAWWAWWLGGL